MGNSILYVSLLCSSVSFSLPGDQEVGRKAEMLGKGEVDSGRFFYLFKSTKN